jgi:hypothetical protein
MVRVRKELSRTEGVAENLGGVADSTFIRIGSACLTLKDHAADLREVLPEIRESSAKRQLEMRRHAQVVRECSKLIAEVNACCPSAIIYVPHPLTQEIEGISLLLEQSLPELEECDLYEVGSNGIKAMIESITCVDPDGRDVMTEYIFGSIQNAEQFVARLTIRFGDGSDCLTANDKHALDATRKGIAKYAKRACSRGQEVGQEAGAIARWAHRAPGQARRHGQARGSTGCTEALGTGARGRRPLPPRPMRSLRLSRTRFSIDAERMTVHCNGKQVTLDRKKNRRFKLLPAASGAPGVPVCHATLCAQGNPWMGNNAHKIPAFGHQVRRARAASRTSSHLACSP